MGWRRTTWHLHSLIGFWTAGFTIVLGLSGAYFSFPELFQWVADVLDPITDPTLVAARVSDHVIYWIAYLHFGRINGIGIPCRGPGLCDQMTKAVWAFFGLAPAVLAVTGAIVWWNRMRRPRPSSRRDGTITMPGVRSEPQIEGYSRIDPGNET
jgi:uncharacterized iron-regulated membrane protein